MTVRKMFSESGPGGEERALWDHAWHDVDLGNELQRIRQGRDALVRIVDRWVPPGCRVLEAGCGSGRVLAHLLERGCRAAGVDFSANGLIEAKGRWPSLPLVSGDVARLPFRPRVFDRVVALGVLEHFELGPEPALGELGRVVRPDGLLVISVPRFSPLKRLADWRGRGWGRRERYRGWRGMVVEHANRVGPTQDGSVPGRGAFYQYEVDRADFVGYLDGAGLEPIWIGRTAVSLGLRELEMVRAAFGRLVRADPRATWTSGRQVTVPGGDRPSGGLEARLRHWVRDVVAAERGTGAMSRGVVAALRVLAAHMWVAVARPSGAR